MHLRSPAVSQGTAAFLWALGLGVFILLLMLGIAVPLGTSLIVSVIAGFVIFIAVANLGQDRIRERR
jgi:hypothetical protein